MRLQITEDEERKLAADAEKRGISIQEMLQRDLDKMAADLIARNKIKP